MGRQENKTNWRKEYLKVARDLCYPNKVITLLKDAETEVKASIIMTGARQGYYD